ncbi:putative F420-0 ABC transporter substrate-binding protein [Actinotalea sp.]|uniref:putative F420-0 ABC transporter substrate-binding protein n=1 Tax=Actinotalea sp. TaxID=1872145 RepID=UPI002D1D6CAE|nr:putative F420-0 ABC transporter substrate-binding protein [Actinotalea sp.]HQY32573.1 putative F420-0 ABC transporter substrate-binding protein [Actinotalea sp.]HRA49940.1 putative F420-0 ABC transporter substrate-binding protein [Actinotalea sp.]
MRTRPLVRPGPALVAAAAGCALLAGCASATGTSTSAAPSRPPAGDTAATEAYPLTLDNCGVEVTLTGAPERIVAIKSSAIEMLLALGVGDRIVGTGFPDGPPPAELADAAAELPQLSDKVPAAEVVLAAEPDLVVAGWESNLTAEGAGDRATFADLGVATYVAPSACKDPAYQPDRLTFEEVFAEITQMGDVLGVPDAAADLVEAQRADLAALEPDGRGLTALWYSSGDDIPYVGAGIGAPQMILDAVGVTNIAAGLADTWSPFSWEQVAQDDPDLIVLVDAAWNSAEQKRERLAANPATAHLTAVLEGRYLVVPFAATEAGVRNVEAAVDLAGQVAALDLG